MEMRIKCLKFFVVLINQILLFNAQSHTNKTVENRNISELQNLEEKYQNILESLPKQINEARDAIVKDIVTKNMLGYVVFFGFFLGFILDVIGELLMNYKGFSEGVQDTEYLVLFVALLFNSLGNGASHLSTVFNAGEPNLQCSSEDFFDVIYVHKQVLDPQQWSKLSEIQASILTERFQRDFSAKLRCVLQRKSGYKEAMIVFNSFQNLLHLVHLRQKLKNVSFGAEPRNDLKALDSELEKLWDDIVDITDQVKL